MYILIGILIYLLMEDFHNYDVVEWSISMFEN